MPDTTSILRVPPDITIKPSIPTDPTTDPRSGTHGVAPDIEFDPDYISNPLKTTFPGLGYVSLWDRLTTDGAYVMTSQHPSRMPLTSAIYSDQWASWASAITMKMNMIWDDTLAGGANPSDANWIFYLKTDVHGAPLHVRVHRFKMGTRYGVPRDLALGG